MAANKKNYKLNWILTFGFIVSTEIIDVIISFCSPSISRYTSLIVLFGALPIGIFILKEMKKTDDDLRQNKLKLQNIFDTLDVAIWSHDLRTDNLLITPGIEKLYGYTLSEFYKDLDLWKKVIYPDDLAVLPERESKLSLGQTATSEYRIIRPNGEVRWIQDRGFPTVDEKGELVDFTSVLFDVTHRKESEDRYRSLVEMSPDIIAVVSIEKVEYMNEAGIKLLGAKDRDEIIGQSVLKFTPVDIVRTIQGTVGSLNHYKFNQVRLEFQVTGLDGKKIDVEMTSTPILYEGRFAVQVVGRDITDRKQAEKTIQNMAFYDSLTGLPNRNRFKQHLNAVLSKQKDQTLAVLFLDLDRFKIINDTKGHTVGDLILQKVANRLTTAVQNEGLVSRQGGDEFIILLEAMNREKVTEIAERILGEFAHPFEVNQQEFFVTPSIGISIYPTDGTDEETLIKQADTAMYQAKERGKNNFRFYSSNLNGISIRKMELENGLRKALEQNQFRLFYQPQINLRTGEIIGVEALIRWQHPEHGVVSPAEFIPLAEETGLIVPIGKWVLKEAFRQRKKWQDAGLYSFPIAVNISVRQFEDDHLIDYISYLLDEIGLPANQIDLEITESIMQNLDNSIVFLNQLKELGVTLSIDDFGTGYSSLSYLKHLPIDKIKIDKSFVDDILYHQNHGMMVKTIIDMGMNLNFSVIAEGVEAEEQVTFLKQNGCVIGQGYFYSQPLPTEQMTELLLKSANQEILPI